MTRTSLREYVAAIRPRYQAATKREKGVILDEFCQTTGYHRKAAVRRLQQAASAHPDRRGRQRQYELAVVQALRRIWDASGRLCSKRLAPFLPELVAVLEAHGELALPPAVRAQVLQVSPATIDRLLRPTRQAEGRRPLTQTTAATAVKAQVAVRTFGEWAGVTPGSVQADLVAHCGAGTDGFYLTTLVVVDVATGWTECQAVWGKGQQRVGSAVHHIRRRLPVLLRELHTDNGGEFLNTVLYPYCRREGIRFTRGRPYKKNDQAYVEQKNGAVVRRLVGYGRYATKAAYEQLGGVYEVLRVSLNFFQPVRKLLSKERVGATVRKRFDVAQTPYQRLLAAEVLTAPQRQALEDLYRSLNPVQLRAELDQALEALWKLTDTGRRQQPAPAEIDPPEAVASG